MKKQLKQIFLFVFLLLALIITILTIIAKPAADHVFFSQFDDDQYPLVIAHAGSKLYPTDTLYALEQYANMGVDILEMDIHLTKDEHIILIHDDTVDRTTNGEGDVREMTLAEVKELDAGYKWTDDEWSTFPFRGQGITIPTLEEVFNTFPGYPMIVEIKQESPSMGIVLCELLRKHNMQEKVMVPSFSDVAMTEFREACPETSTAASTNEVKDFVYRNFAFLAGTISPKYQALQVPESRDGIPIVTKILLWAARLQNVEVHIWTINDPEDMQRFIDMGVDGIMTDRTDLLLEVLGRN